MAVSEAQQRYFDKLGQVWVRIEDRDRLKALAKAKGVSMLDAVREALDVAEALSKVR